MKMGTLSRVQCVNRPPMLCQKCGLTEAIVHRETVVYRQRIEEHLCAICAGAARVPAPPGSVVSVMPFSKVVPKPDLTILPDSQRPKELVLPERISIRRLSELLRIKPYKAISILMSFGVFASMRQRIEFGVAARLCEHCSVRALRGDRR